jgi:hypothetical protein
MKTTVLDLGAANAELLRRMLADVDAADMCKQPNGLKNHAAWQAGHITFVRSLIVGMLGGTPTTPESWGPLFGPNTEPAADVSRYPSKEELLATHGRTHTAIIAALAAAPEEGLAKPNPIEGLRWMFSTVGHLAAGVITTHDSLHLGQLSVWRRQLGLPRVI